MHIGRRLSALAQTQCARIQVSLNNVGHRHCGGRRVGRAVGRRAAQHAARQRRAARVRARATTASDRPAAHCNAQCAQSTACVCCCGWHGSVAALVLAAQIGKQLLDKNAALETRLDELERAHAELQATHEHTAAQAQSAATVRRPMPARGGSAVARRRARVTALPLYCQIANCRSNRSSARLPPPPHTLARPRRSSPMPKSRKRRSLPTSTRCTRRSKRAPKTPPTASATRRSGAPRPSAPTPVRETHRKKN